MITLQLSESLWPCIEPTNEYLMVNRDAAPTDLIRSGINFSIILSSACYLEGVFETILRSILNFRRTVFNRIEIHDFETRRSMNIFYSRIEDHISQKIGRSTGAAGYNEIFDLLTGTKLVELNKVIPFWEGINALFHFRNALSHGREISARRIFTGALPENSRLADLLTENCGLDDFSGSYRKVEDYLFKLELLDRRFIDAKNLQDEYLFLSDGVADQFWNLAKKVPMAILESLPEAEREVVSTALEGRKKEIEATSQ